MTLETDAYRYAIRNAFSHNGRAEVAALIGKLKALNPTADAKDLVPIAKTACEKINNMGMNEIRVEYERFERQGFELKIPEKKGGLLDLEWAQHEPVVTRYAPNPSAPAHLGHMRPAILDYLYAKKYNGKFILRFDDTDPKLKKPMENGEQLYFEDLQWFGIVPDMVVRASDRLEIYYDYMTQLVEMGKAYVCTCEKESWKRKILQHKPCPCRDLENEIQKERVQKFLKHEYKQGEALLRIKTDLNAEDPSQIDWWLARIVDNPQHYKIKDKHVWPSYNFASAIDDHLLGITLIIRGQEHHQNMLKQQWLFKHFGWTFPHAFHHGRLLMKGVDLSKSKMILGIQTKKYEGWDDPRLFTIRSLRRKGFTPQGIIDLIVDLGVKTSDTTLDLQLMGTFNRPYVENAPIIPLIQDPIILEADFVPALTVEIDGQKASLKQGMQSFYVSKKDTENWKEGTIIRLRNAYVVKINHMDENKINAQFVSTQKLEKTIQTGWLTEGIIIQITMPDNTSAFGLAGEKIKTMNTNNEVLFPNFGYCRIDEKKEKETRLWFTHP